MVIICQEEVIEVSSYLPGRLHHGKQLKFLPLRERRKVMRKHARLYLARHMELVAYPFAFGALLVQLFHLFHFAFDIELQKSNRTDNKGSHCQHIEPRLLIKGLRLDDSSLYGFGLPSHRVLHLHVEPVGSSPQIRIGHRIHLASSDSRRFSFEAAQHIGYHRVSQRIVVNISMDCKFFCSCRYMESSLFVRINVLAVRPDIRDRHLEVIDILEGLLDVDLRHTGPAGDVKIAVLRHIVVGVAGCRAWQPVGSSVMDRI